MKEWTRKLATNLRLTHCVLTYIAIKSIFVPTIHWSEILGIAIVLAVHYVKALIPEQKTLVSYEEDFFEELKRLREEVSIQRTELNNMKLASGILKSRPVK